MKIRAGHGWRLSALIFLASPVLGCFSTPRAQDSLTPHDFYKQIGQKEAPCDHPIKVLPAGSVPGRPHRELASISATCAPGTTLCERRLRERACTLGADALVMMDAEPGANPAAPPIYSVSSVTRSARAIRWEAQ